ncbi:MAG: endonuclease V [Chloroflexota bacterium]|jgi:deoxyribonuclease V|nr:endonuclease V [Chloroflexota bacterium]MDP6758636.1 endonuclease V [Chloroflexota bacterium]
MPTAIPPPTFTPTATTPWPTDTARAAESQKRLAGLVREIPLQSSPELIGGVDLHIRRGAPIGIAVLAVVAAADLSVVELIEAETPVTFPYVPGLLSFRELGPVIAAFARLRTRPDVLLLDGHGRAHPRRFGLACHAGLELDIPTVGCAKSRLTGEYHDPGEEPGDSSLLTIGGEIVGTVLRTRRHSRPLFVSIGHRIDLAGALLAVRDSLDGHRLPVPLRAAHLHARQLATN